LKYLTNFVLTIIGFLLISALPALIFQPEELGFFVVPFFETAYHNLINLFHPDRWIFPGVQKSYPLFPMLWDRYLYSMTIFVISLLIAVLLSHLFMIILQVVHMRVKKILLSISALIESLPDAFIIVSLQLLVILIYKKTNVLIAQIAVFEEDIYLLPVICLSIIPTFLLFKAILFLLKEEESKLYIDLAKMKGLTNLRILLVHTFRNVLYSLFYRSKIIFSFMLSNLFLIEVVFNMNGALQFLLRARGPEFIVAAILIFTPFFLFFTTTERAMLKITGESRELL
jgi:peptide/nickel transport system permease protein